MIKHANVPHSISHFARVQSICGAPQKDVITDRQILLSTPPSDNPAGEEAGCGGPGCNAKFSQTTLEAIYSRAKEHSIIWQQLLWTFLQSECQLRAPSKLEISVAKLHILEWPFILPSTRCTCVMIMLYNQLLDMPHLSG